MKVLFSISVVSATASLIWSQEADNILPSMYPTSRYIEVWENSPFNREVIKQTPQTTLSKFAQSLVLEGMVNDNRRGAIAYLRDQKEKKSYVVSSEASNSHSYTLVSASQATDPRESKVTITNGKETAEIGYPGDLLSKKIIQPESPAPDPDQNGTPDKKKPSEPAAPDAAKKEETPKPPAEPVNTGDLAPKTEDSKPPAGKSKGPPPPNAPRP